MRTASAHMSAMYARHDADCQTRARCLWLMLRDGSVIGLTDHDEDLTVDMLSQSDGPLTFRADTGILASDVSTGLGLDAGSFEVSGPLGSLITRAGLLGKRYNRARARLFEVDWNQAQPDSVALFGGHVTEARIERGRFVFEVRSLTDLYNQVIGRVLSPYCTADFGDRQCGVVRAEYPATIATATSAFQFTISLAGAHPDRFFEWGTLEFADGPLAGTQEAEVFSYAGASGAVELLAPLAEVPQIGAALVLRRGCSKLKASDDAALPTCAFWENVLRFRGHDQVPGSDNYIKVQVPGAGGA